MQAVDPRSLALADGEDGARRRPASAHATAATGSSVREVPVGCRPAEHGDCAEEVADVLEGRAEVVVGGEAAVLGAGGAPHVRTAGDGALRSPARYAAGDMTSTGAQPVQPDGERAGSPTP